jgi:hypothetical protein
LLSCPLLSFLPRLTEDLLLLTLLGSALLKYAFLFAHLSGRLSVSLLLPLHLRHLALLSLHLRHLALWLLLTSLRLRPHLPLLGRTTAAAVTTAISSATLLSRRTPVRVAATAAFTFSLTKTVLIQPAEGDQQNRQCR